MTDLQMRITQKPMLQRRLAADKVHEWANLIVGLCIPRRAIRKMSLNKRNKLVEYVAYIWDSANDNKVRRVPRPKWFPKKWLWPKKGQKW